MALQLGLLPMEVLDEILVKLDIQSLLALLKYHPPLERAIDPWLFNETNIRETMVVACKLGDEAVIRRALAHKADPSLSGLTIGETDPRSFTTSNLLLTLDRGHPECFTLLIDAGATMEGASLKLRQRFFRHLVRPGNRELLRTYVHSRASFQSFTEGRETKDDFTLANVIMANVSIDIVRTMLDLGAGPNQLTYVGRSIKLSPLSAAIKMNNEPVFDLLIERGASVNAHPVQHIYDHVGAYPYSRPSHIPIFAAAEAMGDCETSLLPKCLQMGADINTVSFHLPGAGWYLIETTTPLLTYIDSTLAASRFKESEAVAKAIEGLALLLRCGASLKKPQRFSMTGHICRSDIGELWIIMCLLAKYRVSTLCDPVFFGMIKYLVEKICRPDQFDYIPEFVDSVRCRFDLSFRRPAAVVFPKWFEILGLMIKHALPPDRPTAKDELLRSLILQLAFMFDMRMWKEMLTSTIGLLLNAGASLNTPLGPNNDTVLHEICRMDPVPKNIYNPAYFRQQCWACALCRGPGRCGHLRAILELFKYLLDKGADPQMRDRDGRTPLQVLEFYSSARFENLQAKFSSTVPLDHRSEAVEAIGVVLNGGAVAWTPDPEDEIRWDQGYNCHLRHREDERLPYRYI